MTSVLEWVQCGKCGRRHRWKAELVGTEIACACGMRVPVPAPTATPGPAAPAGFDPEDTLVDTSMTNEAAMVSQAPPKHGDDLEIEDPKAAKKRAATAENAKVVMYGDTPMVAKKATGIFGLSRQNEMIVYLGLTMVAFIMVVHAVIVQWPVYIVLSVLLVPIALWKFIPSYKAWRGNRSFKRAWAESFGGGEENTPDG